MKAQAKSAFIIFVTLIVGALIGTLATSAVINNRIEQLEALRRPGGFSDALIEIIKPDDDVQREQIRDLLERSDARMHEIRRSMFQQMGNVTDSLEHDLSLLMTPEQRDRLYQWQEEERAKWRDRGTRQPPSQNDRRRRGREN